MRTEGKAAAPGISEEEPARPACPISNHKGSGRRGQGPRIMHSRPELVLAGTQAKMGEALSRSGSPARAEAFDIVVRPVHRRCVTRKS